MRDSDWLVVLIVQERRNSIANALELCLSCAKPSNYGIFVARKKSRTTQKRYGPPRLSPWVVRWATQDFVFCAALGKVVADILAHMYIINVALITLILICRVYVS